MTTPSPHAESATLAQPTVRAEGWGWRHPGRKAWAVEGVDVDIPAGQKVLLVGSSGSGKSTLLHGLAGVLDLDGGEARGTLTVDQLPAQSPRVRGRVGLVQQDPESQRVMGRIGDEVAFGLENLGIPQQEIWPRVSEALKMVGLHYPLAHPTSELSGGEKQRLALACALAMNPQVMLLDEPTANLDPEGADDVRESALALNRDTGATLVIVEHNIGPWLPHVDRMIVMTRGHIIADGDPVQVIAQHRDALLEAGVWLPGENPLDHVASPVGRPAPTGGVALSMADLAVGYPGAESPQKDLNHQFPQAVSTCVVGPNGVGKTTLALTLAGLLAPAAGKVEAGNSLTSTLDGAQVSSSEPIEWDPGELLGRISMVFQEPQYQFVTSSVEEELSLGPGLLGMEQAEREELVEIYLDRLRLRHLRKAHPLSLSGGERRRLGVGTALIASPSVVVLDEPTFGQDFNTWCELVGLLKDARSRGVTLIAVTHDRYLVEALGEQVLELRPRELRVAQELPVAGDQADAYRGAPNQAASPAGPPAPASPPHAPKTSALSRVNPAIALLALFVMTLPLMATIDPVSAGVAVALELLLLPLAGLRPRQFFIRISPLLFAAPLAAVSMLLYAAPAGEIYAAWGPVVISQNSVTLSISIALRVFAVGMPAVVILPSLGSTEVADALTQVAHLPSRFVLSSLAAIRMVGLMLSDWQALHRARRSRGLKGTNFARSALSLVTFALRRAEALSVSMEARGFGSDILRTNARDSVLSRADVVMMLIALAVPAIALVASALTGQFTLFGIAR